MKAKPVRLLVFSKDKTLFSSEASTEGDARQRHIRYVEALRHAHGPECEIRVITYTPSASGRRYDEPAPGLRLYGTGSFHRATYLFGAARLIGRVLEHGWRPTAVTVQTPWEEGVLGAVLAWLLGIPLLAQLHFDLTSAAWADEHVLNPWRRFVARRVLRRASRVRVVSQPLKTALADFLPLGPCRIDVIPVGVTFSASTLTRSLAKHRLLGSEAAASSPGPVALFVGRLTTSKNLPLWLDVAADVAARRPDARFVIVGQGELADDLKQRIHSLGLKDRILMTGAVGHRHLPDVYAAADLFLLTADHEGFGRVILEAAFAGVPSVATRCVGPEDLIEDGRTGRLLPVGDRPGLVEAVLDLFDDPELARSMGRRARAAADARFGLDSLAKKLADHWAQA